MGIKSLFGFGQARDKPVDKAADAGYTDTNEQVKDEIVTPEDGSKLQEASDAEEKNGHHKRKKHPRC